MIGELARRLKGGFCPWPGTGRVPVSFVHVDDVAQAFLCAVRNAPPGISVYNVADDLPVTWKEFLLRAAQLCKAKPPGFLPKALVHLYAACDSLARRATGREPILTRHAMRLLTTPKALSNIRVKRELGFQPGYPSYSEGLKEALRGLSHNA